jgi:hypothetical protein
MTLDLAVRHRCIEQKLVELRDDAQEAGKEALARRCQR